MLSFTDFVVAEYAFGNSSTHDVSADDVTMEWIVVADQQRCRLLAAERGDNDRLEFKELDQLQIEFLASEHSRPSPLGSKDGHAYASHHDERGEQLANAVRQVVAFLRRQGRCNATRVHILAPARLMGALRKKLPDGLPCEIQEQIGEYTKLTVHQLARHPVARAFCTS